MVWVTIDFISLIWNWGIEIGFFDVMWSQGFSPIQTDGGWGGV